MDLWFVAAAAAAGYLAKYWQNVLRDRDRDSLSELSSKRRKVLDRSYSDRRASDGVSDAEVASASKIDSEKHGSLGNYENCNLLSISTLPPRLLHDENLEGNECGNGLNGDIVDNSGNPSTSDMDSFHGSARHISSLRNKHSHRHFVKPLNSLESCLMAQLYPKHIKMEEYVLSPIPSPSLPTVRPLFVTDGNRIISRASSEFGTARFRTENSKLHKEVYSGKNENVLGVPPLPQIGSLNVPKKMKFKSVEGRVGKSSSSSNYTDGSLFRSQGSHDGTLLFCLGISIGVISSFLTSRREVNKLKEFLRQTENLVQDLQEELEMKDSLTVKELANENYESPGTCNNSFHESMPNTSCPEQHLDIKHDDKELCDKKAGEGTESMSNIEAELEAELKRMELNMKSSSLERRLCDCVELDPDFEADFAQGELRADMINKQFADQPESDKDASGTSTNHSANYGVSPRELSLRLHEVIQSRLEDRVKELEAALENSHRKLERLEFGGKELLEEVL
ncbi:hypothetical protein Patl1_18899 [Pistacia atlantica]|uniref:Uncharacterized protein n=1 Tax=Pistacia atlantica TaxID=434234 RepID=A0ACC1C358_9ROSI|nr:hypothetical protein Patl1_18899 [Pistacia atlantica]